MGPLFIAFLAIAAVQAEMTCTPGSLLQKSCNICRCLSDGKTLACTDKLCPEDRVEKPKQVCQPRSNFMDYCNYCTCSDDGTSYACTKMLCDEDIWEKDGTMKSVPRTFGHVKPAQKQVCIPNTQFKEYCNTCFCSKDGLNKVCTMMACGENVYNKDGSLKIQPKDSYRSKLNFNEVCEPGSTFSPDNCNSCVCNEEGTHYYCTMKACEDYEVQDLEKWGPKYKQGDACTPGKRFYSECNMCVCLDSGRGAYCTFMDC